MLPVCTRLLFPKKENNKTLRPVLSLSQCCPLVWKCSTATLILNRNTLQTGLLYNTGFILGAKDNIRGPLVTMKIT